MHGVADRRPDSGAASGGAAPFVRVPFPARRQVVLDVLSAAAGRYSVHALVEFDVTEAVARLRGDAEASWTGFVMATLGRAIARHPELNARRVRNSLLQFSRVDVAATVERDGPQGPVPVAFVVHAADEKSPAAITGQLRAAKAQAPTGRQGRTAVLTALPAPVRRAAFRLLGATTAGAASFGPCVGVTSLGMFGHGGGWAIPVAPLTVVVTVGAVVDRPIVRDGAITVGSMLPLTLSFDHAVVDGAPAARFTETLRVLTESAAAFDT